MSVGRIPGASRRRAAGCCMLLNGPIGLFCSWRSPQHKPVMLENSDWPLSASSCWLKTSESPRFQRAVSQLRHGAARHLAIESCKQCWGPGWWTDCWFRLGCQLARYPLEVIKLNLVQPVFTTAHFPAQLGCSASWFLTLAHRSRYCWLLLAFCPSVEGILLCSLGSDALIGWRVRSAVATSSWQWHGCSGEGGGIHGYAFKGVAIWSLQGRCNRMVVVSGLLSCFPLLSKVSSMGPNAGDWDWSKQLAPRYAKVWLFQRQWVHGA